MRDVLEALERQKRLAQQNKAYMAQKKYCATKGYPLFIPSNGQCYSCHKDIFQGPRGINQQKASTELITGCPYCSISFVD